MASHRKPKQRSLTGGTAWTAAVALAGAAATAMSGTGHAETRLTTAQVREKVDRYQREAEEANEKYNGAKEKAGKARQALDQLRDEAARRTARLNASRNALGAFAAAQYRSGTVAPTLQLALSSSPEQYLRRASLADRVGSRQAAAVAGLSRQARKLRQVRGEAQDRLDQLRGAQAALARHKGAARKKLAAAQALLDRLTSEQRRRYEAQKAREAQEARAAQKGREAQGTRTGAAPYTTSGRAARAVSYAYGALGKPYIWGATGPHGYDCSGLTQAAWQAAGVALPRTTYTQINAGRRVSRTELAPGDLVFFYAGVSHVGLYIGGGRMIHAPRPGAPVRVAPIDQMPFAGATRPA
ncbi:NlpC/P60 family protein [Streptomyces sp. ME19-01-6]|uniref:C40 family peptidase n=1 Tax=Streptomyces sp. ME19-01-6 TaxID=3028686 RepID=UPI0029B7AABD|nr:NlpC/P60 family protein [Streptomyces sp. ME19-01-6]MDX3227446.1 NlpC/P60 family protein [Streptomyces sp. ME19-01-6]